MWITVMFDLPVVEKAERKAATDFRNTLLDMGFEMSQFSVYMRFCSSQSQIDTYILQVEKSLPTGGKVNILQFTDKQYERIITFQGKKKNPSKKSPDQYDLF
ncbi:CRISPR-associated protein Cas2 [Rugosibacter aromaticivorans]|uniref:CRISPR-associated endoribonuclease Cas2 n=2 Tax=Rugosibacter aromaticivorans TaxID=1565605 RepID=A0A0C5J9L4_9PROT|nr:CRISPR-associated endonuclease Cas2 [Rugosibacter aromaticivorans]AJP48394.1 CRISPR-associated protein Cas2 [Rugosibacter aromaticivorans]TBR12707.1 MAG: CRISPR-associated endonuclease Cas2 [Rugosibacter sp.]